MLSDLASSIMRRRASIEPDEEEDDEGDVPGRAGGGVLGLGAYLAAKERGAAAAQRGGSDEEWE
jgi:hypothetical protein